MTGKLLELNNQGVLLLLEKNLDGAVQCFTDAILHARLSMKLETTDEDSPKHVHHCKPSTITSIGLLRSGFARAPTTSPHNAFIVYDHAFAFDGDFDLHSDHVLVSAVLFYNLGLAHHRRGLTRIQDSTTNLHEAMHLYKQGINIIRQNMPTSPSGDMLFLLVLALLNNIGHIFSHFCQYKDVQACRSRLDVLLESNIPASLSEEATEFFSLGKFYRSDGYSIAAAAAA